MNTKNKAPRRAPKKENFVPYASPILHSSFPTDIAEISNSGEATLFGVLKKVLLPLQNERKWAVDTCSQYSRIMEKHLYRKFENRPFSELTEEDFQFLLKDIPPMSAYDQARYKFLVRLFVQKAFDLGFTQTLLWGIPDWDGPDLDDEADYAEIKQNQIEQLHKRKRDQIFGAGRAISPVTELSLFIEMLAGAQTYGELIAGLIIWICGARPSEAYSLKFKHFRLMSPGHMTLARADDSSGSVGGKTVNSFRHLYAPLFFAEFIQYRRRYIRSLGYSDAEIDEMYIACPGTNFTSTSP